LGDTDSGYYHGGGPTLEEKTVVIDVWHKESTSVIAARVNIVMKGLDSLTYFVRRVNNIEIYEQDTMVFHAHMTYELKMISK
jgi:hypothetical protein